MCVCVHAYAFTQVYWRWIVEEAKQGMGRDEQRWARSEEESCPAAQSSHQVELHLKDTYCMPGAALGTSSFIGQCCKSPPPTVGSQ